MLTHVKKQNSGHVRKIFAWKLMECLMATPSNIHFYLNWAKERLDEIEAVLASLEDKVGKVQANARDRTDKALTGLRKSRDIFRKTVKKQTEANEAVWTSAKAKLEPEWNSFEAEVRKYVESFSKQIEQQRATFKLQLAAQLKTWREAADKQASGRRRRSGGNTPEADGADGDTIMVRADGGLNGNPRCVRSCQLGSARRVQASCLMHASLGRRSRREAASPSGRRLKTAAEEQPR
jgi:hypothetical protein